MPKIPKANASTYIKAMGGDPLPINQLTDTESPLMFKAKHEMYKSLFWNACSPREVRPLGCSKKSKSLKQLVSDDTKPKGRNVYGCN